MSDDFITEMSLLTVEDYKRCLNEMYHAHPYSDADARMCVRRDNPEYYPYINVILDVDGTKITLERRVSHEEWSQESY